jgi:hypothetical protein
MRYTVVWHPAAQSELARLWNQAPDRRAVSDAANAIDRMLARNPLGAGRPYGADRVLTVRPLQVLYSVSPDDCQVTVHVVRRV